MLTKNSGRPRIHEMNTTLVGHEVRRARSALGLTLAQLSERTGLPVRTIHGIETGESRYPTEPTLRPLADALTPETCYRTLALLVYGEVDSPLAPAEAVPA